jgi:Tfp pilus assembly PilM family ATPase
VLGIEIARGGIRFVEMANVGGRVAMRSHGEVAYGSSEELAEVLRMLSADLGVVARDVHVVDSTSRANLRIRTMPKMPAGDLAKIVAGEIETESELAGEALVGDWMILHEKTGELEVLVGKTPARERDQLAAACATAGFRLQAISSASVALARHLIVAGEVPDGEMVGILDIGRSKMNMALVTHESVRLVREVYQGVSGRFLREDGKLDDLEAIGAGLDEIVGTVEQIRRTLQQYQERYPGSHLHHLVMTGETTRISRLLGLLQHDLQVPVRTYDPSAFLGDSRPEEYVACAATYAVPWVLATTPSRDLPVNFAEGVPDLRPARALQAVSVAAVAGSLALAALGLAESRRAGALEQELTAALSEKSYFEAELGMLAEVQFQWERWVADHAGSGGLPSPDLRPYLAEINRVLPDNVRLTGVLFRREGGRWRLGVDALAHSADAASTHAAMERFVEAVAAIPLVARVEMLPIRYADEGAIMFRDELLFRLELELRRIQGPAELPGQAAPPPPGADEEVAS